MKFHLNGLYINHVIKFRGILIPAKILRLTLQDCLTGTPLKLNTCFMQGPQDKYIN